MVELDADLRQLWNKVFNWREDEIKTLARSFSHICCYHGIKPEELPDKLKEAHNREAGS